jgi:alpha-glucosidase
LVLGAITNENSRELKLSLDFLSKDKNYQAIIYKDGKDAHYNKNPYSIDIMERIVTSKETLSLN